MKTLIVDDEPLAREGLQLLLAAHEDIVIVGFACDGPEAIEAIQTLQPDLVFLDINMPGCDGFEVLSALDKDILPQVIFLTAYDEFAIEAFRVNALDYLLKPLTQERLDESVRRAKASQHQQQALQLNIKSLLSDLNASQYSTNEDRLVIRNDGHVHFLKLQEIIWVEADGDYVSIHTNIKSHLVRETMRNMEGKLSEKGFQRIHRSSIVNLSEIRELVSNENGDYDVVLNNGAILKLSRTYRDALYNKMSI